MVQLERTRPELGPWKWRGEERGRETQGQDTTWGLMKAVEGRRRALERTVGSSRESLMLGFHKREELVG